MMKRETEIRLARSRTSLAGYQFSADGFTKTFCNSRVLTGEFKLQVLQCHLSSLPRSEMFIEISGNRNIFAPLGAKRGQPMIRRGQCDYAPTELFEQRLLRFARSPKSHLR